MYETGNGLFTELRLCLLICLVSLSGLFQYGGDGHCWISDDKVINKMYAFGVPMLVLVSINIIFFICSFISLFYSFSLGERVNPQRHKCQIIFVYLRLFTIMGVTWLIGFLPSLTGNQIFWYPFSLFNGLQGLYVLLAFGLSPSVRRNIVTKLMSYLLHKTQVPIPLNNLNNVNNAFVDDRH